MIVTVLDYSFDLRNILRIDPIIATAEHAAGFSFKVVFREDDALELKLVGDRIFHNSDQYKKNSLEGKKRIVESEITIIRQKLICIWNQGFDSIIISLNTSPSK